MKPTGMASTLGPALLSTAMLFAQIPVQGGADANGQASVQTEKTSTQASGSVSSSPAADSNNVNAGLTTGTTFSAALITSLDSRKAKSGDQVVARTTEKVRSERKTILPTGTKLIGHVTMASARAKGDTGSALGIAFDRAVLKDGQEIPLNVGIQALASAANTASSEPGGIDAMSDTAVDMGAGGGARGRGAIGSASSAVGGTVGSATSTTERAARSAESGVNSSLNSTATAPGGAQAIGGLSASGQLKANSRGVFYLDGISLESATTSDAQGSLITSVGKNVHLDSGTRVLMVVQATSAQSK